MKRDVDGSAKEGWYNVDGENLRVRLVMEADLNQIAAIEADSITDGWSRQSFTEAWNNPQVIALCACSTTDAGQVLGYVFLYHAADEGEIPTIAVAENARRRGIGSALLDAAEESAASCGVKKIFLEVRESNAAARALYGKQHFTEVGKRKHFYEHPQEDAVVMKLDVK